MVESLDEILAKEKENPSIIRTIPLYLSEQDARWLVNVAQRSIGRSAWVIQHLDKYPEAKRNQVKANAEKSAKRWQTIAGLLESQLK